MKNKTKIEKLECYKDVIDNTKALYADKSTIIELTDKGDGTRFVIPKSEISCLIFGLGDEDSLNLVVLLKNGEKIKITLAKFIFVDVVEELLVKESSKGKRYQIKADGRKCDVYIAIDMNHKEGFSHTLLELKQKGIVELLSLDKYEEIVDNLIK